MLTIKNRALTIVCALAIPALGVAAGAGDHSHEPPAQTCTPEHEAMGHCSMDGDHAHANSTVGQPVFTNTPVNKVITVHLVDSMRFNFSEPPTAQPNEVIRFVVMNKGKIPHEFSIGSSTEHVAHREMMRSMPDMKHEDGQTVTVAPGETKQLTWQFANGGVVQYACNIQGHFESGMHHEIKIQ